MDIQISSATYHVPYADLLPPLGDDEYAELRTDIVQRGIIVPVVIDEQNNVIDGQHRLKVAAELGLLDIPFEIRPGLSDQDKEDMAWDLNAHRRHMTREYRQRRAVELRQRGLSYRDIAGKLGVSHTQAKREVEEHSGVTNVTPEDDHILGRDGKKYPAKKKRRAPRVRAEGVKQAANAAAALSKMKEPPSGATDARTVCRQANAQERAQRQAEAQLFPIEINSTIEVYGGDALAILPSLPKAHYALLLTDPPYNTGRMTWDTWATDIDFLNWTRAWLEAALPLMRDEYNAFVFCSPRYTADIEVSILRPLGLEVKSRLIWHHRNLSQGRDVTDRFINTYDVALHFGTAPLNWPLEWDDRRFDVQTFAAPQTNFTDTKLHQTQKPIELIKLLCEVGSLPGDSVLDPFSGAGTTGLACKELGRDCTMIDLEFAQLSAERVGVQVNEL